MSAVPVVSGVGDWRCNQCGHHNAQKVRLTAVNASVACAACNAFNQIATVQAASPAPVSVGSGSSAAAAAAPSVSSIPVVTTPLPLPLDDESILHRFQSFLRLQTVANEGTTNGANEAAVAFLKDMGERMGLTTAVYTYKPHRPLLVMSLAGRDPSLHSILLNSHYDVVPVMRHMWTKDPFDPTVTPEGLIVARGTQDMKSVCMQYLEAMLRLLRGSARVGGFLRTVHLSFQPDEETGGEWGMQQWVQTAEFRALNVGFALDEGIANPNDEFTVFYGERGVWWMTVKASGPTGHASRFIANPATSKLMRAVQHFLDFRELQEAKLLRGHAHDGECGHALSSRLELGDVITLNLTVLKAGVTVDGGASYSMNVVPMEAEAGFDLRLPPHVDLAEFEAKVQEWTKEDGLSYTVRKFSAEYVTSIDEQRNPFWSVFKSTLGALCGSTRVAPQIFPAGTDSRFLRKAGIPVIGFSPLNSTPVLLHDHNEHIGVHTFMRGISVYQGLIPALANLATVTDTSQAVYAAQKQAMDHMELRTHGYAAAMAGAAAVAAAAAAAAGGAGAAGLAPGSAGAAPPATTSTIATSTGTSTATVGCSDASVSATASTSLAASQTDPVRCPSPIATQTDAPAPTASPIPTQTEAQPPATTSSASAHTQTQAAAATPIATQTEEHKADAPQ